MSALIDGADFFGALRSSMLKAEHSIVIVGWDVDSRVRLRGAREPVPEVLPHGRAVRAAARDPAL